MNVFAGTSGYSYSEWKGRFYPGEINPADMLSFYSGQLPTVELNSTFYRIPKGETLERWAESVPDNFRFTIKASRRITHEKRLRDAGEITNYLCKTIQVLGPKLGPVLFQLPPFLRKDDKRLGAFLEELPKDCPYAIEFRHASWNDPAIHDMLKAHKAAWCIADLGREEPPIISTADWTYIRLHAGAYSDDELQGWVEHIQKGGWKNAYVFFKHDEDGPKLAKRFNELVAEAS